MRYGRRLRKCAFGDYFGIEAGQKYGGYGQAASLLSSGVDMIDPANQYGVRSGAGAIGSGALKGASSLAFLGPVGMAAGALGGGVMGHLGNQKALDEQDKQRQIEVSNIQHQSQGVLAQYPSYGYARYGMRFPRGGKFSYNPNLAPSDIGFQNWYSKNTLEGQSGTPYSDKMAYDYYSFYKNKGEGNIDSHFPDTYKRGSHPTFSNESIYSTPEEPGGRWRGEKFKSKGKFIYPMGGQFPYPTNGSTNTEALSSDMMKYEGNTHEQGGIPLDTNQDGGADIEVEDEEVIRNNTVYSDRLKPSDQLLDGAKQMGLHITATDTYASIAERLGKKKKGYEDKLDSTLPYVKNTGEIMTERVDGLLDQLFQDQQLQNNNFMGAEEEQFKKGGIYIKPSKRGTFTAAAKKHGMGVQAFASKVLANKGNYSSAMVKKANFAKNASKWKHNFGGYYPNGGITPEDTVVTRPVADPTFASYFNPESLGNIEGQEGKSLHNITREDFESGNFPDLTINKELSQTFQNPRVRSLNVGEYTPSQYGMQGTRDTRILDYDMALSPLTQSAPPSFTQPIPVGNLQFNRNTRIGEPFTRESYGMRNPTPMYTGRVMRYGGAIRRRYPYGGGMETWPGSLEDKLQFTSGTPNNPLNSFQPFNTNVNNLPTLLPKPSTNYFMGNSKPINNPLDSYAQRSLDPNVVRATAPGMRDFDIGDYKGDIANALGYLGNQAQIQGLETNFNPTLAPIPGRSYRSRIPTINNQFDEQFTGATQGINTGSQQDNLALRSNLYGQTLKGRNAAISDEYNREDAYNENYNQLVSRIGAYNTDTINRGKMISMDNRNQKKALSQANFDSLIRGQMGNMSQRDLMKLDFAKSWLEFAKEGDTGVVTRKLRAMPRDMRKILGFK